MSVPGEGYSVDLTHLDEVTAHIRAFKGFVADNLSALDDRAKALSATWSSEAATAYETAHREWLTGANEVRDGLAALEAAARTAHENYTGAIAANLRMLGL
ncbi:WXG100 family type VII secretion target [Nocardia sp. NPDC006630]|uniref:WXG100 family type VII secretion target n=1 Tax=Nocardia sp. NPDC006630 TaxID=3157181 RepID=UPI0033ADBCC7